MQTSISITFEAYKERAEKLLAEVRARSLSGYPL
jgi:hypothetical protein